MNRITIETAKEKLKRISLIFFTSSFLLVGCEVANKQNTDFITDEELRIGFQSPPENIQTTVYWHWVNDNISKEGVIKDLYAMKEKGINRAFIANIGLNDTPTLTYGNVKFQSEEWWDILHAALKTAGELNIEMGIFNTPGWSQSGGPWVKPEQAMRYLASSHATVEGGKKVTVTLPKPNVDFQDVKVIAYPVLNKEGTKLNNKNAKIAAIPNQSSLNKLLEGDNTAEVFLKSDANKNVTIDIIADTEFTLRTLKLFTQPTQLNCPAKLQVKEKGQYKTLKEFKIDRYNAAENVGFDPYAPIVISVPAVKGKEFRIVASNVQQIGLRDIVLSSVPTVERYPEKTIAKMFQSPLPYWHEYQWETGPVVDDVSLLIDNNRVLDISQYLSGDKLAWDAPQGDWVITRMGMTKTGSFNAPASEEFTGLEIDKMSAEHTKAHFDAFMGEVLRRIPAEDRKTWKVVVQDSYETGGQNFTDGFIEKFKERYGYDMVPFLPVYNGVVVQSMDASDRFLWDMRRLVADMVAYEYVGGLRDASHEHGLVTWLENYGHWGFPGEFLQYGGQSDEIAGEFWAEGDLGDIENRAASSCGHIYGKTKISSESFTAAHYVYGRHPAMIKPRGDRFFSEGINNTLLHVYIHQPDEDKQPGINTWYGTEFNRFNTWYSQLDLFTDYIKRVNFMLQQGLNVADAAYFIGEDAPKMTGVTDPALPKGYQYDYINAEIIERDMTVKGGLLTLPHGTQYKILVLPKLETMRPELLKKIKQLIEDGGVVLGPKPMRSPSFENFPQADKDVQNLAQSIWGDVDGVNKTSAKVGKGMIMSGLDMEQAMELIDCTPDFKVQENDPILFGHRTLGDEEIYFVTNQSDQLITINPEFRVKSKQPELWDATSGKIRKLPAYKQTDSGTIVPMKLDKNESVFIVFKHKATASNLTDVNDNYPTPVSTIQLTNPWTVKFDTQRRGPATPLVLSELKDISKDDNFDIRHYSGAMIYDSYFDLDDVPTGTGNLVLDLNDVNVMAKVKINGQYVGGVWTPPYTLDITEFVKEGNNKIEVEVVNTYVNRIIGDLNLPEDQRKVWLTYNTWKPDSELHKSGLIGPVEIKNITYK